LQAIQDIPHGSQAEALQLAVNCSHLAPDAVAATVDQVAAQLEPAAARRLLITALKRQHADTAFHMLLRQSFKQRVTSGARSQIHADTALITIMMTLPFIQPLCGATDLSPLLEVLEDCLQPSAPETAV
jgi:hypothetical protein